jgi:hypothetical protein
MLPGCGDDSAAAAMPAMTAAAGQDCENALAMAEAMSATFAAAEAEVEKCAASLSKKISKIQESTQPGDARSLC